MRDNKTAKGKARTSGRTSNVDPASPFDLKSFRTSLGTGLTSVKYRPKEMIFRQGDPAEAVFYIGKGGVQLTVVSHQGKEGVIALLHGGEFFGEGCLAGQEVHMASATAVGETSILSIGKVTMVRAIVSTVNVIIPGEGSPYGVLEIGSPHQHDYDQHDIDFLTGFANVLAAAVMTVNRAHVLHTALERMKVLVAEKDRLLEEKNILAQELQHRVRNNLQLVYGMLTNQLEKTKGEKERRNIKAIARQVSTLAQVYDHLLGSGMNRTIDFGEYLKTLSASLAEIEAAQHGNVDLVCQTEPLVLDLDTVTSLGIVVAELVSNSYGHAFPDGRGRIDVSLQNTTETSLLTISDNGVGFKDRGESKRHGLGLVRRLMEQVGGTVEVQADRGTTWNLRF